MSRIDSASRVLGADPGRVFAALLDPQALEQWLPPSGMSGRFEHFDARPGGSYRLILSYDVAGQGKSTSAADVVDVRFLEITPQSRVVQAVDFDSEDPSFAGTMMMTWELRPTGRGTHVEVRAENVPVGSSAEDHQGGMASTLDNLAAFVEGPGA